MEKAILPIHFEDRSGTEFERLVFAYLVRLRTWNKLEWLGQLGSDGGRDIWGVFNGESYCYQCANYKKLILDKITNDIDKLANLSTIPDNFIAVCGNSVSTQMRSRVVSYAQKAGIAKAEVWSGVEFEERVRKDAPDLIRRFVEGEAFPDSPEELILAAKSYNIKNDEDMLDLIIECFDRPAFTTKFQNESNIPAFEKAIADTIEVLNTGMHRLRDGQLIRTIPSRHRINDAHLKNVLREITQLVTTLRDRFVQLKRDKEIRPCGCGSENCSIFMLSDKACEQMDQIRSQIFEKFRSIKPGFQLRLY